MDARPAAGAGVAPLRASLAPHAATMNELRTRAIARDSGITPGGCHRPGSGGRVFGMGWGALRRDTLRALGDTLFPAIQDGDPPGGTVVPDAVTGFMASGDPEKARALGAVLTLFELGSVPRYGRRFSRLPAEARHAYVDGWMRSRLAPRRIVFRSLKQLCALVYYQDARTWSLIHYKGPLVDARPGGRPREESAS